MTLAATHPNFIQHWTAPHDLVHLQTWNLCISHLLNEESWLHSLSLLLMAWSLGAHSPSQCLPLLPHINCYGIIILTMAWLCPFQTSWHLFIDFWYLSDSEKTVQPSSISHLLSILQPSSCILLPATLQHHNWSDIVLTLLSIPSSLLAVTSRPCCTLYNGRDFF